MSTFHILGLSVLVFSFGAEVIMFLLQAWMLHRYKHKSFLLLAIGSAFIGVSLLVSVTPYIVAIDASVFYGVFIVSLVFTVIGVVLGVWGTWWLFCEFGRLYDACAIGVE